MVGPIRTPDQRLRVFISSTLGELAEERRAARSSIEQLRLTPVMFELGARPHPPRALYRSYLEQSDVFVGIYWQRYGWVAPDMEVSGLEDEMVLSAGMPRLVYVKRPAPEIEPRLAEMLARLQAEDSVSYRPFETADELHDLLLDDLALLLTERFDTARPGPEPASDGLARRNLPAQTTSFVGRDDALRVVGDLLADEEARLLTLTGPGGSGKTRLAVEAAARAERVAGGVWFVDLSAEREADGAFAAVARTLGVPLPGEARPVDVLKEALAGRHLLIVLDNFEQVMDAAIGVADLLEACPRVRVLVTSREALRVRGEHVFGVEPLSLPADDGARASDESEAVRLFVDRARAARPDFRLTPENAAAVASVCRLLDGLPLAIELAAARMRLFDVDELHTRLEQRLDVLGGGLRDLPQRQQTLRSAIDWSYELLGDGERSLFGLFGLFAGARLADVEAVARHLAAFDTVDVIDALGSLVDKSLVRASSGWDGGPRFAMLRTIRAHALERLDADPDLAAAARGAHAEHYCELASRLQHSTVETRRDVLRLIADELGNVRSAWDEWVARGDVTRLNRMLAPLWGYYDARGDYRSAVELGRALLGCLAATPDSPERRRDEFAVRMSVARTELALQGYTAEAEVFIREALERAEAAGDDRQRFSGLRCLGHMHMMRTDFDQTEAVASEVMAMAEAAGDPALLAEAHILVGMSVSWKVDFPSALPHYAKAIAYAEATPKGRVDFRVGPHPVVVAHGVSALTQWFVGLPDTASASMARALDAAVELDHPYSVAYALHHAGLLDLWRGDLESLAMRSRALRELAELHDYPMWQALGLIMGGVAMVGRGDVDPGMAQVEKGFTLYRGLSTPPVFWAALLMIYASTLAGAGRLTEAIATIEEAESVVQQGDPVVVDLQVVHGDLLLASQPTDLAPAIARFEAATELAARRGARAGQLQALTRLARLRDGTPDGDAAREALRRLYDELTEGRDLAHMVAARAALGL